MRFAGIVGLLVALGGCDLVFSLEGPPRGVDAPPSDGVEFRLAFSATSTQSKVLSVQRPASVQDDDLVVAVVQALEGDSVDLEATPLGFSVDIETFADSCLDGWSAWVMRGRAGTAESFDFEFDTEGNNVAVLAAYKNAGDASLIDQALSRELIMNDASSIEFAPTTVRPGSVVWIGAVASEAWNDAFVGMSKQRVQANVAVFDARVDDGVVAGTAYDLPIEPAMFCPVAGRLRIEPP